MKILRKIRQWFRTKKEEAKEKDWTESPYITALIASLVASISIMLAIASFIVSLI